MQLPCLCCNYIFTSATIITTDSLRHYITYWQYYIICKDKRKKPISPLGNLFEIFQDCFYNTIFHETCDISINLIDDITIGYYFIREPCNTEKFRRIRCGSCKVTAFWIINWHWVSIFNTKNEIIIPIEYEDIYYLTKNRIVLKIGLDRFIIINEQNKQICKTIFEVIDPKTYFSKNPTLYSAKLNGKWGFIDKNGNVVIDFKYTHTYNILGSDEKYIGVSIDKLNTNTLGLIDKDENQILPFEYEFPYLAYIDNDRFIVSKNGKCGIIDRNNNVIANFIFDDIFPICLAKSEVKQYYQARVDDKYGFIDRDGKPLHIDKESLNISETELNLEMLSMIEQIKYLFS